MDAQGNPKLLNVPAGVAAWGTDQALPSGAPRLNQFENDGNDAGNIGDTSDTGGPGVESSDLQAMIQEGAAISIQATWRGRRTANALSELRSMGMTDADIQWMVQQGHHLSR